MAAGDKENAADSANKDKKKEDDLKKVKDKVEEMTEEDLKEKEELDTCVEQLESSDAAVVQSALALATEKLKTATSTMTSVPRPLKFLRPHYEKLKEIYAATPHKALKPNFADVISFLATGASNAAQDAMLRSLQEKEKQKKKAKEAEMEERAKAIKEGKIVVEDEEKKKEDEEEQVSLLAEFDKLPKPTRESLMYRLEGNQENITSWGNAYLSNLSGEISGEYHDRIAKEQPVEELKNLVHQIVPSHMASNDEVAAIDLLCELDMLTVIPPLATEHNFRRTCDYLLSVSNYAASGDERVRILKTVHGIFMAQKVYPEALRVAMKLNDKDIIMECFDKCEDMLVRKQMAFMAWRQHVELPLEDLYDGELMQTGSGELLSQHYLALAKELDLMEPRLPEEIYKSHLEEKRGAAHKENLDSAKENLASTFVNGFVNAGFCSDKLMTVEGSGWLYKNKEHGMMSAAASLGLLLMWDVEGNLSEIDKYQWSKEEYVKAGALLAFGLLTSNVKSDCDPVWALLSEQLEAESAVMKTAAVVGLGFAYAGSQREDLLEHFTPMIVDTIVSVECSAMAAVSLGMAYVSTCNVDVADTIVQTLLERQGVEGALDNVHAHFFAVGLGLVFLGQQDACETVLAALDAVTHPIGKYAKMTVETCAFVMSGDVLKVQSLLAACAEHLEDENEAAHQAVAVLGLALVALGEEVGSAMVLRQFDHIIQYGELPLRRAIPLAMGVLHISNPKVGIIEIVSKMTHDADADVALNAIFAMGLMGAGTNNARIAGLLRQLAGFYSKDANALFLTRIAQGMLFAGKGLVSMTPIHSDRFLCNPVAMASLITLLHAQLHSRETILSKSHYLLYHAVGAMSPRFLVTLDENLEPLPVSVRVGAAVDTVGQAGKPKRVTGFQTHTTPVLLSFNDRAELGDEEYLPLTNVLEGFVILRKNPDWVPEGEKTAGRKGTM